MRFQKNKSSEFFIVMFFVILYVIFLNEYCFVSSCEWNSWNAWDSCSRTCGGGNRIRSRLLCCPLCVDDQCVQNCGPTNENENELCNKWCANGTYTSDGCYCPDGFYGYCCEIGMLVLKVCLLMANSISSMLNETNFSA